MDKQLIFIEEKKLMLEKAVRASSGIALKNQEECVS